MYGVFTTAGRLGIARPCRVVRCIRSDDPQDLRILPGEESDISSHLISPHEARRWFFTH